ncbi:MAG TPA: tetratricopeptide repeat protein, partial [Candidatus Obscuribacterales bacterium]
MRRLKHLQYWLLGLCVLGLCVVGQPAIARSPQAPAIGPTVTLAQGISAFEERAQAAYGRGDYQTAAALLQQAQQQYRADQNLTQAAIALSNLSLTYQQLGDWPAARAALDEAWAVLGAQPTALAVQAQMLDVQGQLEFAQGQIDQALATWQRSDDIYGQLGNPQRQALSRLNQVQALQAKGLFQQVQRSLTTLASEVSPQAPTATKASILRQLGDSLRATGNLDAADQRLQESLQVAEQVSDPALIAASYLSLGNLAQGRFKRAVDQQDLAGAIAHADAALAHYQQVAARDQGTLGVQARLNVMQLLTHPRLARWDLAIAFYPTLQTGLPQLPPGRATIMAYTGLAETLITLRQQRPATAPSWADIATLLA